MNTLSAREKSLLRALTTRGGRKRSGCCRCEGVRAVQELLENYAELIRFTAVTERGLAALGVTPPEPRFLSEREMEDFSGTVNSQGVIAVASLPPEPQTPPQGAFILALDQLGDPGNFGTIARTLRAVGGEELWYTKGSIDPWCDKAVRSGLGAQFGLKLRRFETLADLLNAARQAGFPHCFIASPHDGESCFHCAGLFDRSVIVIGGEPNGALGDDGSAAHVIIPMPGGFESLNAAQAATVLLFESVRRSGA